MIWEGNQEIEEVDEEIKKIKSEILVNAAGPHAREVASMLGVKLDLVNVYQQKIAFEDTLKNDTA